jgi:hypothetical protein
MKRSGVMLIELLVYLAGMTVLALLSMQWLLSFATNLRAERDRSAAHVRCITTLACIARDLEQAPAQRTAWQKCDEHVLAWRQGTEQICWEYTEGILKRHQTRFEAGVPRRSNTRLGLFDQVAFTAVVEHDQVREVVCTLSNGVTIFRRIILAAGSL